MAIQRNALRIDDLKAFFYLKNLIFTIPKLRESYISARISIKTVRNMLSFFKKKQSNKRPFQNWQIPVDTSYQMINNGDSIQFVNADGSRILYFSLLTVEGNSLLTGEILAKMSPSVTRSDNGWQFKGARQGGNEVLVCAFTFMNESDEVSVKELFTNIVYIGKQVMHR
jgi:hypothetical protein